MHQATDQDSSHPVSRSGPSDAVVAAICGAEILGLAGYSIVPALLPQVLDSWSLTNAQGGWLAGIVFAGYMLAVVPLVSLTDRLPARRIYLASSTLSALSCFGVALSNHLLPALAFRAIAGIALAGMYMPGLRALTDGTEGTRRTRIAAFYTSSFTIGASLSFLLGWIGVLWGWRSVFILAGLLGITGALFAWAALPQTAIEVDERQRPTLDFRPVFANREALVLIFGYAAAIWGSAGLRQWIVVFLVFCFTRRSDMTAPSWDMLAVGALINFLGVPAGLLGNELSIRFGLRSTAISVFLLSAMAGGLFGFVATLPYVIVVLLAVVGGFIVQGNFVNLTSGLLAVAAPRHMGTTMALYSCVGIGGGFVGTLVFGFTLDQFASPSGLAAWTVSFGICGLACLVGSVVTMFLTGHRPLAR